MSKKNKNKRSKTKQPPLVVVDRTNESDFVVVYADPDVAVIDRSIERSGEYFCFEEYRQTIPDKWREAIGEFDDWNPKKRAREIAKIDQILKANLREANKRLPKLQKKLAAEESKTARSEAGGRPCVIIDRDADGNHRVYADPSVVVFSRSADIQDDPLYRYTPSDIPEGWLDRPAGFKGDGSAAEERALVVVEAMKLADDDETDDAGA